MIEQRSVGTGVRIGDGSLYDWVVEEIVAGGEDGSEDEVDAALRLLATVRIARRRTITRTVEAVLERRPRRRRTRDV